jgi:lipopolysaccharide export system protein LptA
MRLSPSMKSLIAMAARAVLMATVGVLAAQSAAAQPAKAAKSPIDITADRVEAQNNDCVSVWTGSAEALRDTSRLRADTMIAHMEINKNKPKSKTTDGAASGGCGDLLTIEAKNNVYYVSTTGRRVHGDNGFYDAMNNTITITGDVTAVDGQNVMRGTKMVYNTETGDGHVEGGAKGPNAKNRPRGVFYPKDAQGDATQDAQSATGAKSKKPAK